MTVSPGFTKTCATRLRPCCEAVEMISGLSTSLRSSRISDGLKPSARSENNSSAFNDIDMPPHCDDFSASVHCTEHTRPLTNEVYPHLAQRKARRKGGRRSSARPLKL